MVLTSHQIALLVVIVILGSIPIISGIAFLYWNRIIRFITKNVYSIKFPHKIFCAVIHYPQNKMDRIYKIIPDTKKLKVVGGYYHFTQDNLKTFREIQDKVIFMNKNKKLCFSYNPDFKGIKHETLSKDEIKKLNSKPIECYYVNDEMINIDRGNNKIPEVHYWFNNPNPIEFNFSDEKILISAKDTVDIIESEVCTRLLKLAQQNLQMILIIILSAIAVLCGGISAYKSSQIYDGLIKAGLIAKEFIPILFIPLIKKRK